MMGAVIGGLIGGIVGTAVIPVPILGTIAGAVIGSFAGAAIIEYAIGRTADHSFRVGIGAAKGRFWGIVSKTLIGLVMTIVVIVLAIPLHARKPKLLPPGTPTTLPTTAPVTQPTTLPAL
jgi:uncharacterized protein YqgC (DUF456 family)